MSQVDCYLFNGADRAWPIRCTFVDDQVYLGSSDLAHAAGFKGPSSFTQPLPIDSPHRAVIPAGKGEGLIAISPTWAARTLERSRYRGAAALLAWLRDNFAVEPAEPTPDESTEALQAQVCALQKQVYALQAQVRGLETETASITQERMALGRAALAAQQILHNALHGEK